MDRLKQLLDTINVTYTERIFESEDGIAGLGSEAFVSELVDELVSWWYYFPFYPHRIPASEYT